MSPASIRIAARVLAAALLALAGPALAQTLYKYARPDGSLVYSDKPIKGARLLERFTLVPTAPPAPQRAPAQADAPRPQAPSGRPPSALDLADAEVRAALQAVEDARARLEEGVEPLPGERLGIVGAKTSRLSDEYFARVQQLEDELRAASDRLEQAYRRRTEAK